MKQLCQVLILALFFLVSGSPVRAQHTGPYLGVLLGGQLLAPAKSEGSSGTFNLEYRPAPSASVVLGWELEPGSSVGEGRVEVEYTRRSNRLKQAEFAEGNFAAAGDLSAESLLINTFGVYRSKSPWTPYVGAGIGAARLTADDLTVTGRSLADDEALVFAYQFGGGVELGLTRSLSLDFGYRFLGTTKAKFAEANGGEFKSGYLSHSAMLGLRLGF